MKKILLLIVSLVFIMPAFATVYSCTYSENGMYGALMYNDTTCNFDSPTCRKGKMLLNQGKCTAINEKQVFIEGCQCKIYMNKGKYNGYACGGNGSSDSCNANAAGEKIQSMYARR